MSKIITLREAVELVRPGDILALGGMTLYRRPVAFVRELLRQRVGELTLLELTGGFESDLLVGAGLVRRVRTCYFGLETFGLAPMFTRLASSGGLEVIEETEATIAFGLRATLAGVGFMPGQGLLGTDILAVRPDIELVTCPYTKRQLVAFPALRPDVAVVHCQIADRNGNARLLGNKAIDRDIALTANRTVLTAERIVDSPADLGGEIDLLGARVTAVVEAPGGAKPTSCFPLYPLGSLEILDYVLACQREDFAGYLERFLGSD